jgi:hypothetical protein
MKLRYHLRLIASGTRLGLLIADVGRPGQVGGIEELAEFTASECIAPAGILYILFILSSVCVLGVAPVPNCIGSSRYQRASAVAQRLILAGRGFGAGMDDLFQFVWCDYLGVLGPTQDPALDFIESTDLQGELDPAVSQFLRLL